MIITSLGSRDDGSRLFFFLVFSKLLNVLCRGLSWLLRLVWLRPAASFVHLTNSTHLRRGGLGEETSWYWLTFRAGAWPPFMSISATSAIVTDFIVQVLKWTLTTRLISSKLSSKVWRTSSGRVRALRENWITTAKFIVRGEAAAAAHLSDGPGVHTAAARARLLTATATTGASHLVAGRINSLLSELHHFYHHWCLYERYSQV